MEFLERIFVNESLFFFHILVVISFVFLALRLGKSALTALVALQGVFANLFVVKQITLFGFSVTCSDVFAIGAILSLNLLQEYFGKEAAKHAVKISFLSLLFFVVLSQVHLFYTPNQSDVTQVAFQTILTHSVRIVFASLATFFIVQQFDLRFFGWLKGKLPIRVATSLVCSQFLDTALFSILGLYGIVESVLDIMIVSFIIKCMIIFTSSPFVVFSKRFVRNEVSL